MQLYQLQKKTVQKTKKRIGRGGSRGKTSGRGHKGQKARAGHRIRPEVRDAIKKLPKRRGYGKNRARTVNDSTIKPSVLNLDTINTAFSDGELVTPESLVSKKLLAFSSGRIPPVKILGHGEITKKISVSKCLLSDTARSAIEKAGGSVN